jgi:hypothetical protein
MLADLKQTIVGYEGKFLALMEARERKMQKNVLFSLFYPCKFVTYVYKRKLASEDL